FTSPIAYLVMAIFSAIMGYMFFSLLNLYVLQSMQFEQLRYGKGPSFNDSLIRPIFGNMNVVLLFIVPFITMRLFAEEKKNNTIELLFTAPIKMSQIVLGKYLSALLFVLVLLLLTIPYPIALSVAANPDWGVIAMCYLGTILMIGTYIAVGVLCSSITENQIVAGALTFGTILFFWIIKWASYNASPFWSDLLSYLSIVDHFEDFSRGIFNTRDIVFFASSIGLWLFLTYKTLESYSWRS
ncbi:MAG TPA: ABC transporter permease subunit, partial [Oligoflexia bacterium]|nr:ABC transporter permease subunit [Oligoflexia bacterium]